MHGWKEEEWCGDERRGGGLSGWVGRVRLRGKVEGVWDRKRGEDEGAYLHCERGRGGLDISDYEGVREVVVGGDYHHPHSCAQHQHSVTVAGVGDRGCG